MSSLRLSFVLCATLCAPWCAQASARQDEPQVPNEADWRRIDQLLAERERGAMHPSVDPTVVIGREQQGNDLRSRTPALEQSDHLRHSVDPEELHLRTLAMYEDGATFNSPLTSTSPLAPLDRKRVHRVSATTEDVELETGVGFWTVLVTVLGLAGIWLYQAMPRIEPTRSV